MQREGCAQREAEHHADRDDHEAPDLRGGRSRRGAQPQGDDGQDTRDHGPAGADHDRIEATNGDSGCRERAAEGQHPDGAEQHTGR